MALPQVIYVMGPPGAGKGTQAQLLADKIGYDRFSTGDAFRELAAKDTPLGVEVKNLIDNGLFAPPPLAAKIVIEAIGDHLRAGKGIIFDGSPRTLEEAVIIDKYFIDSGYGHPLVIVLKIDREEMEKRNSKRRFCLEIKGQFAVMNDDDVARCEQLGGTVGVRPDDEPAKFAARWQQFQDRAYPVIENYTKQGIAHEIDGMQSIEVVHDAIMKHITSRQA